MSVIEENLIDHPRVTSYLSNRHLQLTDLQTANPALVIVESKQPHGNDISWITTAPNASQCLLAPSDALITNIPNVFVCVRTADCLPILGFHPAGWVFAIHAGRRGTEAQILAKTLKQVKAKCGSSQPLFLWFGPRICTNCYQIDPNKDLHYDLIDQNLTQLKSVYAQDEIKLSIHPECTACNVDTYHSYRKEGPKKGRIHSLISFHSEKML